MFDVKFTHVFVDFVVLTSPCTTLCRVRRRFVTVLNWCCLFEDISFDVTVEFVFMAMLQSSPKLDGNIKLSNKLFFVSI